MLSQAWGHMPAILALRRLKQEDVGFELAWANRWDLVSKTQKLIHKNKTIETIKVVLKPFFC